MICGGFSHRKSFPLRSLECPSSCHDCHDPDWYITWYSRRSQTAKHHNILGQMETRLMLKTVTLHPTCIRFTVSQCFTVVWCLSCVFPRKQRLITLIGLVIYPKIQRGSGPVGPAPTLRLDPHPNEPHEPATKKQWLNGGAKTWKMLQNAAKRENTKSKKSVRDRLNTAWGIHFAIYGNAIDGHPRQNAYMPKVSVVAV